jgi:hypothetical protein
LTEQWKKDDTRAFAGRSLAEVRVCPSYLLGENAPPLYEGGEHQTRVVQDPRVVLRSSMGEHLAEWLYDPVVVDVHRAD